MGVVWAVLVLAVVLVPCLASPTSAHVAVKHRLAPAAKLVRPPRPYVISNYAARRASRGDHPGPQYYPSPEHFPDPDHQVHKDHSNDYVPHIY